MNEKRTSVYEDNITVNFEFLSKRLLKLRLKPHQTFSN